MSEQTPDTNSNMADGQDPSMEDILASIRKIIADDDVQEPADIVEVNEASSALEPTNGDVADLAHVDTLDLDIITDEVPALETDIDTLIGDMDVESSGALELPQIDTAASSDELMDDVLDLEIPLDESEVDETEVIESGGDAAESETLAMDDTLDLAVDEPLAAEDASAFEGELDDLIAEMDDEIISRPEPVKPARGLMGGAMAALGLGGAAAASKASSSDAVQAPEEDLSLMLDNMLEDSASYQEAEATADDRVVDPAEDLLAQIDLDDAESDVEEVTASDTDPDIDLVKSLMADLTEEPLHDKPEIEATDTGSIDIDDDASTDDVMDEILSMTLDDETKLSEEIAIPEISTPEAETTSQAEVTGLSLKEIAAQADADAQSSDSMVGRGLAAAAGLGVVGAATMAASTQDDAPEADDVDAALSQLDDLLAEDQLADNTTELDDLDTHTPEPHLEETPKMARAKKSDAIIDEVTETATAGAFASLTNVVEEKATVAERGDRIGDLVMEALQPMLKEWLDANLKGIVERAVTKEVKRISSGK